MRLGFVSAILPELGLDEVVSTAASIGYDCVEVMCWPTGKADRRYAGVTHIDVCALTDEEVARIHSLLAESGVSISALGYYPNPLHPNREEADKVVAHLKKVMEGAKRLGIDRVNTFVGRDWNQSLEANWPRFLQTWQPLVEHAQRLDLRVGIENCPMLFTRDEWPGGKNLAVSPEIWRRMYEAIPSPHWGLNFDPSHCVWQQMCYLKPLGEFASRLVHVHAKDARLDRDRLNEVGILAHPNQYHTPKLPGLGDVDWGKFFSKLNDVGYRGAVCVEVEDRAYEDSRERRMAALRQSHDYLRQYVPKIGG
jgi:sugar phosphate isomerase/epimerase